MMLCRWEKDLRHLNGDEHRGGSIRYVVVGIGINVNTESFPPEISDTATSLKLSLGHELKRAPLIGAVLKSFEQYYSRFMEYGDMTGLWMSTMKCLQTGNDRFAC